MIYGKIPKSIMKFLKKKIKVTTKMKDWMPKQEDINRWHQLAFAKVPDYSKHWSIYFSDEARALGFKYTFRPHGNCIENAYLASNNPEAWRKLKYIMMADNCHILDKKCGSNEEKIVKANYSDGSIGVIGYFKEL